MRQVSALNFEGQSIYCGVDVHKTSWSVSIRDDQFELKTFSQPPNAKLLGEYLHRNYPKANHQVVYEAGFSGFSAQRALTEMGIKCMIAHPADVPSTDKDRQQKTDKVDCRKLARSLKEGHLKGIYIPSEQQVCDRIVVRTRKQLVRDQTRLKNRILSWLYFFGIDVPKGYKNGTHFSKKFISWLEGLVLDSSAKVSMQLLLESLKAVRSQLLTANRQIRLLSQSAQYQPLVTLLRTTPGVGLINSMTFLTELGEMNRFNNLDKLCSYTGLTPNIYSSADTVHVKGITRRCNHNLREALVESAWQAIRKDPALLMTYKQFVRRMDPNKAIIKIARKLLSRIRYVLMNKAPYVPGVVR